MIATELEAKVLRLYHVEKWRVGTIARQIGLHHNTVRRVLRDAGMVPAGRAQRASMIEAYLPFIGETLERYPRLPASRLYEMVRQRGYPGRPDHFRHLVALHRPRLPAEAYLRLRTLPGEQAQMDWGHFGTITIGRAKRALMAFVLVLSWSRHLFLRFYPNARLESFLRGHQAAFQAWGGLARVVLYDNLKSAVLERRGEAIRFHPRLWDFAQHYRFEPRPVAIARGNEKGRVERAIRYVRTSFFAARRFRDLDDLNAQAAQWCAGIAADRRCPEDPDLSVREAFEQERAHLIGLPDEVFATDEHAEVTVGKTPYVRFDGNDYSIPHTHVRRLLAVVASPVLVRVLDGSMVVASHRRSYSQREQVEDPEHIRALVQIKRAARGHRSVDRLHQAVPRSQQLLVVLAQRRFMSLGSATAALLRLLDHYGAAELDTAIAEVLERDTPHPHSVRLVLERRRHQRGAPPSMPVELPDDPRVRELVVRPHALADYDNLAAENADDKPSNAKRGR